MTKWIITTAMDEELNYFKSNGTQLMIVSGDPTAYASIAAMLLATAVMDSSDYTVAASGTGRKVTVAAQSSIAVASGISSATSTAHACVCSADTLLLKTTCTVRAVQTGDTLNTQAFVLAIAQPT